MDLGRAAQGDGNSMAVLIQHIAGNFASRFTDFLTTDGEKPWRDREAEFTARPGTRDELRKRWETGWETLEAALRSLSDDDLGRSVTIRGQPLSVREALHRSLAHASYHVGQMVMLGRSLRGDQWRFLSIPPGMSAEYNRAPSLEKIPVLRAGPQEDIAAGIVRAVTGPAWHGPALSEVLTGIDAAGASARPAAGIHTIGELVRHITFWCDDTLSRLGRRDHPPEPAQGADWPPLPDGLDDHGWEILVEELSQRHRALADAVKPLSQDLLRSSVPGRTVVFEDMLRGVVEHAAYHGGQIAILRRSLHGV